MTFDFLDLPAQSTEPGTGSGHYHAPHPFRFKGKLAEGVLEIVYTLDGERMRATLDRSEPGLVVEVVIDRAGGVSETLHFIQGDRSGILESTETPQEPHEFEAFLELAAGGRAEAMPFSMKESAGDSR